jgi:hypothetical protein
MGSRRTGRLLRTGFYPGDAKVDTQYVPSKMIFVDELAKGKKTTVTLSDVSKEAVPDSVYTKSYIERVNC